MPTSSALADLEAAAEAVRDGDGLLDWMLIAPEGTLKKAVSAGTLAACTPSVHPFMLHALPLCVCVCCLCSVCVGVEVLC